MKPLAEKSGSMATPSSPISEPVHTGIVTSVVVLLPSKRSRFPPFSVISNFPSGRKAMPVGVLRPPTTNVSVKPGAGVPARAGTASAARAASASVLMCRRMQASSYGRSRNGRVLYFLLRLRLFDNHGDKNRRGLSG
jgi:hypothetical protein